MKRRGDWMERLAEGLDLPSQPLPGLPLVEISGDKRVLIENHRGVTQYGRDKICVKVKSGQIMVQGCDLEMARMTRDQLVICGRIDCVSFLRREC